MLGRTVSKGCQQELTLYRTADSSIEDVSFVQTPVTLRYGHTRYLAAQMQLVIVSRQPLLPANAPRKPSASLPSGELCIKGTKLLLFMQEKNVTGSKVPLPHSPLCDAVDEIELQLLELLTHAEQFGMATQTTVSQRLKAQVAEGC